MQKHPEKTPWRAVSSFMPAIDINRPPAVCYAYWRDFTRFHSL